MDKETIKALSAIQTEIKVHKGQTVPELVYADPCRREIVDPTGDGLFGKCGRGARRRNRHGRGQADR